MSSVSSYGNSYGSKYYVEGVEVTYSTYLQALSGMLPRPWEVIKETTFFQPPVAAHSCRLLAAADRP